MKHKFYITTTVPETLGFFVGQPRIWKESFDVCAISSNREKLCQFAEREGIEWYNIDMARNPSLFKDIISLKKFIVLFLKRKPEIVHAGTPKASLLALIAAWITRRPIRIYMCHGLRYQAFSGIMRIFLMLMEKISCACATDVICISNGTLQGLLKDNICRPDKARIIRYGSSCGINLIYFNKKSISNISGIRKEIGVDDEAFLYLFAGRIVHDKGVEELVRSFKKIQQVKANAHLVILGSFSQDLDPVSTESIEEMKENHNIHLLGQKNDVRPYMSASDLFVLPSYREGLSTVLVEAGAMELASITCDVTGCSEIIEDGVNGVVISSPTVSQGGNPQKMEKDLYDAMLWCYEHPENLKVMGTAARKRIEDRFDEKIVWKNYYEEYKRIVNRIE